MAKDAVQTVTVQVTVDSTAAGTITARVRVTGNETDPIPSNNQAEEETMVQVGELTYAVTIREGNLDATLITLTDFPDPVFVGDNLTYTLNVINEGNGLVDGVLLTVTLPSAVDFGSVTAVLSLVDGGAGSSALPGLGVIRFRP